MATTNSDQVPGTEKSDITKLKEIPWLPNTGLTRLRIRELFDEFDKDKNNILDVQELQEFAFSLGEVWSTETCQKVFEKLDKDQSGGLDLEEFSAWFLTPGAIQEVNQTDDLFTKFTLGPELFLRRARRKASDAAKILGSIRVWEANLESEQPAVAPSPFTRLNHAQITPEQVIELFKHLDQDRNDLLGAGELQQFGRLIGEEWSDEKCAQIVVDLDSQCAGGIDAHKFTSWLLTSEPIPETPSSAVFLTIQQEASSTKAEEPLLASMLDTLVLTQPTFAHCLAAVLSSRLAGPHLPEANLARLFSEAYGAHPSLLHDAAQDLAFIRRVDPAAQGQLQPLLFFKGFLAAQAQRVAHSLWTAAPPRRMAALALQGRVSEVAGVDAHPGARLAGGLMLDHGSGIVIGETAVVGTR